VAFLVNIAILWHDAVTGASRHVLKGHSSSVHLVAFLPDSKLLASASDDNIVRLWDAVTGASRGVLKGHSRLIHAVAFSPDGRLLASASSDNTVRLWDAVTGAPRGVLKGYSSLIQAVAFSPDSKLLASTSYDKIVRLWDIKTTKAIQKLSTKMPIYNLSFSNNRSYLKTKCRLLKLNSLGLVSLLESGLPESKFLLYLSIKE
jgi:WD40 repeat protein